MGRETSSPLAPLALALLLAASAGGARAQGPLNADTNSGTTNPTPSGSPNSRYDKLAAEFMTHWLSLRPQNATRIGIHDEDGQLVPITDVRIDAERAWYRDFQSRLDALARRSSSLSFERRLDLQVLSARVRRDRLDLDVVKPFENNPNSYLPIVAGSIQSLLDRRFAPICNRLGSVSQRLRQVPEVLRAAKINLKNPPKIATESAISQFQGALRLYREQVPLAAQGCREARIQADLAEADSLAVTATVEFIDYLREDLLSRSTGSFALGPETYARKLEAEELETQPVDSLLARGYRELERTRTRMQELAERIAPGKGVEAALEALNVDVPSDSTLVPFVSARLDTIREFLGTHRILSLPEKENLRVREAPLFARSTSFASMDSPGVWEKEATEAYYNVTPVEASWDSTAKHDHLAFYNRWAATIVSIHEALPGHYYQFLALRGSRSPVRQMFTSGSYTEGWAHYCEQMMIEQGFGRDDPRYELAQQYLALGRLGRLIVGISLHTQGMTYEDAEKLFHEQCWMAPVNAAREARRGTMDPTYLVYTLGKWRILDLREEVKRRMGDKFDLRRFHDALLREGASPLPVARLGVLHDLGIETKAERH
jgi:uncharacterized protein (DUF885 family)